MTTKTNWTRTDTFEGAGVYRSSTLATDAAGRAIRAEVSRLEPGRWSVELTGSDFVTTAPVYACFANVHAAKAFAVQYAEAHDGVLKMVRVVDQGELRSVLEGSGYCSWQADEAREILARRRARVAAAEATADAARVGDITSDDERVIEISADGRVLVSSPLEAEEIEAALRAGARRLSSLGVPYEAPAPTTAQEYKGIAITVATVIGSDKREWFAARAGGRTAITRAFSSAQQARDAAINAIDDASVCEPEKIALWLNDTAHWRADSSHALPADEMLRRCRAEGEAKRQEAAKPATIDLTPTWVGALPALILALLNGTPVGQMLAREELLRMAKAADMAVAQQKKGG